MSDLAIEEKIRKIRQDLYNFNLGGEQSSLDLYLYENCEVKPEDYVGAGKFAVQGLRNTGLLSSQSAGDLGSAEDLQFSPISNDKPGDVLNCKDLAIKEDKENDLIQYNQLLLSSISETKARCSRMLAEKDEKIAIYENRVRKAEGDLKKLKEGCGNVEELKSSARSLINKTDLLESERVVLVKENKALKEKVSYLENELKKSLDVALEAEVKSKKLSEKAVKYSRKFEEATKEIELLYKTIKDSESKTIRSSSFSPKKTQGFSNLASGNLHRKNPLSEDIKTERKSESPAARSSRRNPLPRSKSREENSNHLTSCRILKEIMALFSVDSPALVLSLVKAAVHDLKSLNIHKEFFQSVQSIVVSNSPPKSFKTHPGPKTSLKWVRRLVKEYLTLKQQDLNTTEKRVLTVLRSGLNTNNYEDIPRAISKLLVENEKLLQILSRVKKGLRLENNATVCEVEEAIEARLIQ